MPSCDADHQQLILEVIEEVVGKPLPSDFREFYSHCDGSGWYSVVVTPEIDQLPVAPIQPLVDVLINVAHYDSNRCDQLAADHPGWTAETDFENEHEPRVAHGKVWSPGWVGFCSQQEIITDLDPGPEGTYGQICYVAGSYAALEVAFDSFREFIGDVVDSLSRVPPLPSFLLDYPPLEWRDSVLKTAAKRFPPQVVKLLVERRNVFAELELRFGKQGRVELNK